MSAGPKPAAQCSRRRSDASLRCRRLSTDLWLSFVTNTELWLTKAPAFRELTLPALNHIRCFDSIAPKLPIFTALHTVKEADHQPTSRKMTMGRNSADFSSTAISANSVFRRSQNAGPEGDESMSRRPRHNRSLAFKAKVALDAISGEKSLSE